MRFVHTADWHLGRLFHGAHLTEDQAHVLNQVVQIARDSKAQAIIVAGDIYDRAVPPPEAVELLDDVLAQLVLGLKLPVLMIAGNHDSPGRLSFASRLLEARNLFVTGLPTSTPRPVVLEDAHGPVNFYLVPFAEPATVRECLQCEAEDHGAAMRRIMERVRAAHPPGRRGVVVGHAFVAGGSGSESERPLSVGGAGTVDSSCFEQMHYTALGHLHMPQTMAQGRVCYSGSILKYSFDEAAQTKHVCVVDIDASGQVTSESVPLSPRRDVRRVKGLMADLLAKKVSGFDPDDYLEITLLDEGPVLDAIGRLRAVYANVMTMGDPGKKAGAAQPDDRPDIRGMDDLTLFKAFYKHVKDGDELGDAGAAEFVRVADDVLRRRREAVKA